jgi:biopolymer transport protein ExbB/TolQ
VWVLVLLGGFLRELVERRAVRQKLGMALDLAKKKDRDSREIWEACKEAPSGLPRRFWRSIPADNEDPSVFEKGFTDLEHDVASSLAKLSFSTRLGPMLGLMGTLIPLGPALTGLAGGNVKELAGNLVVAFTTTVVGILVSVVAYGMGLVRRTWYARDMSDLEFLIERLGTKGAK